ncbi:MAG: ArsR/SmtB family transcription factor [Gemmatimonadales bacterium]
MKSPSADAVFRVLADPSRRRMLDLLKARPGLTVGELSDHFEFSRFAVMKHLKILERVGLVVPRREGKTKRLYLNAVPIQTIYDRWISQYSALWASQLTSLKYELEGEDPPMPAVAQLQHVHVVHIRTTPEKLWEAITRPELTRQYFHGTDVVTDWKVGSKIEYLLPTKDGKKEVAITGKVLEFTPRRRIVHTFSFPPTGDDPTKVTYELEPVGSMVKLTMTHEGFAGETKTYQGIKGGWTPIFDGLKSLLETGKSLDFPPM